MAFIHKARVLSRQYLPTILAPVLTSRAHLIAAASAASTTAGGIIDIYREPTPKSRAAFSLTTTTLRLTPIYNALGSVALYTPHPPPEYVGPCFVTLTSSSTRLCSSSSCSST
jgi:hypothetical protein